MISRFVRRAQWISRPRPLSGVFPLRGEQRPDLSEDRNAFWYFRKTFDLASAPREALAHASADGRYHLYVNGAFVGRGPARCDPAFQYFDTRDIAAHLRPGRNVVALLLHSYGRDMSWYQLPSRFHLAAFGCGSVFFQCDVVLADGSQVQVDSDDSWRYRKEEAWQQDTLPGAVGFMEVFDAGKALREWASPELDHGGWEQAVVLTVPPLNLASPVRPFPVMVPRAIPFLSEEERLPAAVATLGEVEPVKDAPDIFEQVSGEALLEPMARRIEGAEALPGASGPATIAPGEGRDAVIVLDFGDVVTGYPRLDVSAPAGTVLDIAYAERLKDGRPEPPPRTPIWSPTVHRYIAREGRQRWEKFEWAGFRYLQITVRNPRGPVTIHRVALNETLYPVEERGSFECSDPMLNRIWRAGAHTLRLCMHDGFEDCPSREQRQWIGDAYVESLTNYVAFGDTALVAQMLRQVAQSQRPDGMTQMATPSDFAAAGLLTIPDWCLCWILSLGKYVEYTGDLDMAAELLPSVLRALDWFDRLVDEHGLLNNVPEWNFVDWAEVDRRGEGTVYNALYYHTLRVVEDLARRLGLAAIAERCATRAQSIREAVNARLWSEERGAYVDACIDGEQSRRLSQQANAVCIAYDIAPPERWERIFATILDESRLALTSIGMMSAPYQVDFDEERHVVLAQPFFMHHVHRALARAGRYDDLIWNIRQRWGAMIEAGATSIWEVWHPMASQCHAWSTTPTFDLSTEVLGVVPLEPGFARVRIAPQPAGLDWARGVFPTMKGDIRLAWEKREEEFKLSAAIPEGSTAEITLPSRPGGWRALRVGDVADVLSDSAAQAGAGVSHVMRGEETITLVVEGPRELELEAKA